MRDERSDDRENNGEAKEERAENGTRVGYEPPYDLTGKGNPALAYRWFKL
jgi:hypothetical protein